MTTMPNYISTTNACKLCKPMGATIAFRGIEGAVPFLHGSQGCATYMRRYIISHFNEPMDIASSALGEKHAIFGGGPNLKQGLKNVMEKFGPRLIGIASTCLTETIGDDLPALIREFRQEQDGCALPLLVPVSTPSYSGTHMEGFHAAVRATVQAVAEKEAAPHPGITVLPGFLSPADLRHLKEIMAAWGLAATILPDISETLDAPSLSEYHSIPPGGTPLDAIRQTGGCRAVIELGWCISGQDSAGTLLAESFGRPLHNNGLPIGIRQSDRFFGTLQEISGRNTPGFLAGQRGRLIDSLADGHKYVFGKKAVVYGEEDLVIGLTSFLAEIGIRPVLCASGGKSGRLKQEIAKVCGDIVPEIPEVHEGMDFYEIEQISQRLEPDILIGHSKGYHLARKHGIPLIRVGFPIHDRLGGQRALHIGYRGAQRLFDRIVNALLEKKQNDSTVGYSYM